MEEFMITDDVFEQIKDFDHEDLTEEQSLLIDKLILNEELKERYKENGLCKECKQLRASYLWCQSKNHREVLEWIEYDRFENIEYLTKGGFGTIYKAIWKDGYIRSWDFENNKWTRSKSYIKTYENFPVVLKCLHNSQDITSDFLREIETHMILSEYISSSIAWCYGITKDPESRNFMIVMGYVQNANELYNLLWDLYCCSKYQSDREINKQIEESDKINEKLTSSSSLYTGPTLSYTTNPQAVYTSRLLDFKNLPEPKNAIDNKDDDNSFGEYSESIEAIDFITKLDLDKSS
ncbi:uncharacterized protein OCT59_013341 [Rhizophagus irregularis]|uniref:uncharacterized protein n=1 Tax=Rhizophagus irregularis TaxID=588596 RepID=UPI003316A89D|nr:hypothetical protein OCT59_013341 [Rhizophagus irregularis]